MVYTIVKYGAGVVASIPVLVAAGLWWFQRRLIYPSNFPEGSRKVVPVPTDVGLPYEDVTIVTADGVRIRAYVIPVRRRVIPLASLRGLSSKTIKELGETETANWLEEMGTEDAIDYVKSRPTIVMFHANAGNMGHRIPLARKFVSELHCNVFMLSYRGYGLSEGSPSERGIMLDSTAAMEYISSHPLLRDTMLVLYGQSIGGAVCLATAAAHPDIVSGVIVENTFLSLPSLIPHVMPLIPQFLLPILLTEIWDANDSIPKIPATTPMLLLSGKQDSLVPQSQMIALRSLRGSNRCWWREFDGSHNDTYLNVAYWVEINAWLQNLYTSPR